VSGLLSPPYTLSFQRPVVTAIRYAAGSVNNGSLVVRVEGKGFGECCAQR